MERDLAGTSRHGEGGVAIDLCPTCNVVAFRSHAA